MKKIFLIFSLIFLYFNDLQAQEKKISSKVQSATVFLSGAQITRTAKTKINAGKTILVFEKIPKNINTQSIQVKGDGDFTILSVTSRNSFFKDQDINPEERDAKIESLEKQKENLTIQINKEKTIKSVYEKEEKMISQNQNFGTGTQGLNVNSLQQASVFFRERLMDISLKKFEINQKIAKWDEEIKIINEQIRALKALIPKQKSLNEIVVAVSSKTALEAKFTIKYLIRNAGWHPTYDIRVKDVESPINLAYKANVFQFSGEDWKNIKLTLSTGDPNQSAIKPYLNPWYLNYQPIVKRNKGRVTSQQSSYQYLGNSGNIQTVRGVVFDKETGERIPFANILVKGTSTGSVTNVNGEFFIQLPTNSSSRTLVCQYIGYKTIEIPINSSIINIQLSESDVSLDAVEISAISIRKKLKAPKWTKPTKTLPVPSIRRDNPTNVSFTIEVPYDVPSDGKQYAVEMQNYELPAYYEYFCVPKLDLDAFLVANITGWEDYNLLKGDANLYFEGTFLGKSQLDPRTVNDTIQLSLGRDKDIIIQRNKVKDFNRRQFLGTNQKVTRAWEIEVRNGKKQSINLVLEDQFPISNNSEVEVEKINYKDAELEEKSGKITWKFQLESKTNRKLNFKYSVKYPKKSSIIIE